MQITRHSCQILIEVEYSRRIFEKYSKLPWNESSGRQGVSRGRTDRQTSMATLKTASRDFANGSKNWNLKYALNKSKIIVFRKGEKLRTKDKWRMNGRNNEVVDTCRLSSLEVTFEAQEVGINRKHRPNLKWATSSCFTYRQMYVSNPQ